MWWNDYGPAHWLFFGPMFILFMVLACVVMMFFMMRGHRSGYSGDSAAQILKERFARGEIDKAEYEERRRVLEG
jgi:putative membrane protein